MHNAALNSAHSVTPSCAPNQTKLVQRAYNVLLAEQTQAFLRAAATKPVILFARLQDIPDIVEPELKQCLYLHCGNVKFGRRPTLVTLKTFHPEWRMFRCKAKYSNAGTFEANSRHHQANLKTLRNVGIT